MSRWRDEIATLSALPDYMILGDEHVSANGRAVIEIRDPGSGAPLGTVPAGTADDIDVAVSHARKASRGVWRDLIPKERARLLWNAGEAIRSQVDWLSIVECLDSGKPLRDARAYVERAADYFCYYAGMVDKLQGESVPLGPGKVCFTELTPIGVTGHIIPWNVPIGMIARSLAPALACGNTAVIKPAEDTPLTAILLADILLEVGIPAGVVNIVTGHGHEAGAALAEHLDVRHVTFTGSVGTGKAIMKAAADHLASVTLELGGKSPHAVLKDADLDTVAPIVLKGIFSNAGQICSSGARLLVERTIQNELVDKLVSLTNKIIIGHGLDNPDMGPLVSPRQLQAVSGFMERARERNAEILCGGELLTVEGCE